MVQKRNIAERSRPMQVKEIMTPNVEVIRPDNTLQEAAEKMKALNVGPLPVCDDGRLIGMITDRDITVRATAEGTDSWTEKVCDVMTRAVVYCYEDQNVQDAAKLMKENQVRRLVVLNRDKRLVGIVSLGDVAVNAGDEMLAGETLERVSETAAPR